ncbi:hypothetical protein CBL_13758 [Carabus blaptoides fortunei]
MDMTSEFNLESIYNELNKLLTDVCSFLTTEVQNGTLSSTAKYEAEKLVARSRKQVETISTISVLQDTANLNYSYLQMQGPSMVEEPSSEYVDADNVNHYEADVYEESYDQIESHRIEPVIVAPSIIVDEDLCPYKDIMFDQLQDKAVKYGPLWRKERYFILEQKKQYFGGVIGIWLLVYSCCKKDAKVIQTINLTDYKAEMIEQKKDPTFRMEAMNKKTYDFIVRTEKDVEQWVIAINCKKQSNCIRNLPDVPLNMTVADSSSDISDSVVNNNIKTKVTIGISDEFESDGDIYENLDDLAERRQVHSNRSSTNSDNSPMLPPRQQIFHNTNRRAIDENVTYNNLLIHPHDNSMVTDLDDGPEEEEEENTYDPVLNGEEYDEDDIYDELRIPEPPPATTPIPAIVQIRTTPLKSPNNNLPPKPVRTSSLPTKPPVDSIPVQNNDYEDEEDCCYDIPRVEQQAPNHKPPTPENTVESDEDVEYDELKAPSPTVKKKIIVKVGQSSEQNTNKPAITSPKPKIQFKLEKLSSFSRQKEANADSGAQDSEPGKEKKIHNIIQQMEAALFKGSKN